MFFSWGVCAQSFPFNLDFEKTTGTQGIFPWKGTSFNSKGFNITPDSVTVQQGRFSLRVTHDSTATTKLHSLVYNVVPLDVVGKKLKFSAYIKQSNPSDTAGIISAILSRDPGVTKTLVRGFPVINAKEWTMVSREFNLDSIELPLHHIRISIISNSTDPFWVDNIKIEIDGKDQYAIPSYASAKNESITPLSIIQTEHLRILGYIWGFLKYFHPQVAKGNFNWDAHLFRMIPVIKKASDKQSLNKVLSNWIDSLGEVPPCAKCYTSIPDSVIIDNLDLRWMDDVLLLPELKNKLRFILANRHLGNGHYVQYRPLKNLFFSGENEYNNWREIGYPNEGFRLQFLFRYWNTIQYFYPYKHIIGKDWDLILREFIPRFSGSKHYLDYHFLMTELVNSVQDSHSGIFDGIINKELAPFHLPVKTRIIGESAVVTAFYGDSLAKANGFMIGDEIEKINGKISTRSSMNG